MHNDIVAWSLGLAAAPVMIAGLALVDGARGKTGCFLLFVAMSMAAAALSMHPPHDQPQSHAKPTLFCPPGCATLQ